MSRASAGCVIGIIFVAWSCSVAASAAEKQITIKVIDGRNGKPLKSTTVDIWYGTKAVPPPTQVTTGNDGNAFVNVPAPIETIVITGQGVADCRASKRRNYIEENVYLVRDIVKMGIVAQNLCSKAKGQPTSGVLLFYVRPFHWWEKMMGD